MKKMISSLLQRFKLWRTRRRYAKQMKKGGWNYSGEAANIKDFTPDDARKLIAMNVNRKKILVKLNNYIQTEEEYQAVMRVIESLLQKGFAALTEQETKDLQFFSSAAQAWELKHYPINLTKA